MEFTEEQKIAYKAKMKFLTKAKKSLKEMDGDLIQEALQMIEKYWDNKPVAKNWVKNLAVCAASHFYCNNVTPTMNNKALDRLSKESDVVKDKILDLYV